MQRRTLGSTRTDTLLPYTTLFRVPPSGKTSGQGPSARTAARNRSVTCAERLKLRSAPACALASMNSTISGWSQRSAAIIAPRRSEEHTSALQSLMRISYAVFCLNKNTHTQHQITNVQPSEYL